MNKSELISAMAAESGLTKADSKKALEAFMVRLLYLKERRVWALILLPSRALRFLQRKLLSLNLVWS